MFIFSPTSVSGGNNWPHTAVLVHPRAIKRSVMCAAFLFGKVLTPDIVEGSNTFGHGTSQLSVVNVPRKVGCVSNTEVARVAFGEVSAASRRGQRRRVAVVGPEQTFQL